MIRILLLVAFITSFGVATLYTSLGNYNANKAVISDSLDVEALIERIPPLYSDAVYSLVHKYESNKQEIFDPKVEGFYSEVATQRPLSPSSWISLANWSYDNEFYDNSAAYLRTSLLLLRNKPVAAWDLFDLAAGLNDVDLSLFIASNYIASEPQQFSNVVNKFEESYLELSDDFLMELLLTSIEGLSEESILRNLSIYMIESLKSKEFEIAADIFSFIKINDLDMTVSAAKHYKSSLLKEKNYESLRESVNFHKKTASNDFSFINDNINAKGELCWTIPKKHKSFSWSNEVNKDVQSLIIEFNGSGNIHFSHLRCGFFLPYDINEDYQGSFSKVSFTLRGEGFSTASGIYAQVYQPENGVLAKTEARTGSWEDQSFTLSFSSADRLKPFYFRLRRNKTNDIDNLLKGRVTISNFKLSE